MPPYQPEDTEFIKSLEADAPKFNVHGIPDNIRELMKPAKTWGWKLAGNELSCESDLGRLVQKIPTGYILTGEDDKGMPLLKKISV